jgi:hypothetical protein
MIVVPLNIQGNFYEDFNTRHRKKFSASKKKMEYWLSQEQYARDYGLEDTGFISLPSEEVKKDFLKRNYLRFISRDVKESNQRTLKSIAKSWSSDDEIDAIREQEEREKFIVKARKTRGATANSQALEARIKVGKKKFKLRFQPRIEMGMLKIKFSSEYLNFQAWLGANGKQEIKFEKKLSGWGTKALLLYYIDETRLLATVDQRIMKGLDLRFTHEKDIDKFSRFFRAADEEINTIQLRFRMGF